MEGRTEGGEIVVGDNARQRFHDARAYGRPRDGNEIALAPVEAAHLLFREDLSGVVDEPAGGAVRGFRAFLSREPTPSPDFGIRFLVYADLRSRGFYLAPAREPWVADPPHAADLVVFPRGKGPADGEIQYGLRVVGERTDLPATALLEDGATRSSDDPDGVTNALAVVDEESEITYFERRRPTFDGTSASELPSGLEADLLEDRVICWDPPVSLYERTFYGQPLEGREYDEPTLQCSLVEAAHLAEAGAIDLDPETVHARGRAVEGDRFDRRFAVYAHLRAAGVVPKTGYKFGADFRTYDAVTNVDDLAHSERLVRVLPADHVFEPRDLSLDVRLAHGVRKTMVFGLVDDGVVEWVSLERLTP